MVSTTGARKCRIDSGHAVSFLLAIVAYDGVCLPPPGSPCSVGWFGLGRLVLLRLRAGLRRGVVRPVHRQLEVEGGSEATAGRSHAHDPLAMVRGGASSWQKV